MKLPAFSFLLSMAGAVSLMANAERRVPPVVLDATAVQNLRIETVAVAPADFEETIFALGRIETQPGRVAAVTSRISGRVVALEALPGDSVAAGAEVIKVESRQLGNPSPVISLKVPLGGVVTRLDVRLGDPVDPDRPLLEVADLSEVLAVARVPEPLAGRIAPEAEAHIRISALPDAPLRGRLIRFGTHADPVGGTVDALFALPNPAGRIRPGMRAEFSIVLARRTDVLSVPRQALQGDAAHRFVYIKDPELPHAFIKTAVVTGLSNDRQVEIVRGLLPGNEVVTRGAYSLAFAGAGSVSLKEALDAAHGHEHNPDGSERSPESRAAGTRSDHASARDHDHDHDHDHADEHPADGHERFWMITSGVLFVLLLVQSVRRRRAAAPSVPKGEESC